MSIMFFRGDISPSSVDSSRASCQLLETECALSTGKLLRGLLSQSVVTDRLDMTLMLTPTQTPKNAPYLFSPAEKGNPFETILGTS